MTTSDPLLAELIKYHDGVLDTNAVLKCLSYGQLRWQIHSGRWQRPCKGVIVTQSGPLTDSQALRVALLRAGPTAALAGLTAARLDGFTGFDGTRGVADGPIYVILPSGTPRRTAPLSLNVITH